jgi:hypothetical protein
MISFIVTLLCILSVHIADKYGNEGRSNFWILGPIGVWSMIGYWIIKLTYEYIW